MNKRIIAHSLAQLASQALTREQELIANYPESKTYIQNGHPKLTYDNSALPERSSEDQSHNGNSVNGSKCSSDSQSGVSIESGVITTDTRGTSNSEDESKVSNVNSDSGQSSHSSMNDSSTTLEDRIIEKQRPSKKDTVKRVFNGILKALLYSENVR